MSDVTTPTQEFGIDETKAVLAFVINLAEAFEEALCDGHIGLGDAFIFFKLLRQASPAFNNISKLKPELTHLDSAEVGQLMDYAKSELKLSDSNLDAQVKSALDLGVNIYQFVIGLKATSNAGK